MLQFLIKWQWSNFFRLLSSLKLYQYVVLRKIFVPSESPVVFHVQDTFFFFFWSTFVIGCALAKPMVGIFWTFVFGKIICTRGFFKKILVPSGSPGAVDVQHTFFFFFCPTLAIFMAKKLKKMVKFSLFFKKGS